MRILIILLAILSIGDVLAVDQVGIAYRYNGKKQRTPLGGVYIKVVTSPNGVVSQEENGQFVLKLKDIKMGDAMGNAIVQKSGMMVFNKEEVNRWHVQKGALVLVVCDANEFQKQKVQLIAIGRNQAEKKYKQKLERLKAQNAKQQLSLDQYYAKLDSLEKEKENALAHMDEYADMFARIDESEIDTVAQKAMDLFRQGNLDEAIRLFEQGNYLKKIDDALKVKAQAEKLRQKADSAEILADKDIEEYRKSIEAQVAAYKMSNEWDKAGALLKELADKLKSLDAIWDYACFAKSQNLYNESEEYMKLCINKLKSPDLSNDSYLALSYYNLAEILVKTRRYREGEQMLKAALDIRKRLSHTNPQAYMPDLAQSYKGFGVLYLENQRFTESEQMSKLALDLYRYLADANPQFYEQDLASIYSNLAVLYSKAERFTESEQMCKAALEIYKRLANVNPQVYEWHLANVYNIFAGLYRQTLRFTESERMSKAALEIFKRLVDNNPYANEPELIRSYINLACLYRNTHRFSESEAMYKTALEIVKRMAKFNPQAHEGCELLISEIYNGLAYLYIQTKRFAESEQMYKTALEFTKRIAKVDPQAYESNEQTVAVFYGSLGHLYMETERFTESEQMYKSALEIIKRLADANPQAHEPKLARVSFSLACLYYDTQRFSESEQMFKAALEISKRLADVNPQAYDSWLVNVYDFFAKLYVATQRFAEGEQMYKAALEIYKHLAESNPQTYESDLADGYNKLANLYGETKRFAESEQMYKTAITIYERLYEDVPQQYQSRLAEEYYWYGMSMINNNKHHDAIGPFERSLKLCKDMMNDETGKSLYIANLVWLVDLYNNDKNYATAYTYNKELLPLLKANYNEDADTWKTDYREKLITQSFCANLLGKFEVGELHSLEALKVDSTQHIAYTNLAAAYLLQGKYQAAEKLYSQYKNEFKEGFLSDFEEFAKANVIPTERMADVEKIKKILNE